MKVRLYNQKNLTHRVIEYDADVIEKYRAGLTDQRIYRKRNAADYLTMLTISLEKGGYKEKAAFLGIKLNTFRSRLSRARAALESLIRKDKAAQQEKVNDGPTPNPDNTGNPPSGNAND